MWKMKERLRTASDISSKRKALRQQLKNYQQTLSQMRSMATAVPHSQMADLMKKITACYEALESVERSAMDAFFQVTGYVGNHLLHKEPPRYLKYSADPLMDVSSYPLIFHLIILLVTEGGLRLLMRMRGFRRHRVGPVSYYYHPGNKDNGHSEKVGEEPVETVPIVFCHGIGVGLIFYMTLIDELLKHGRPLILPEIPYVSGFRPWLGPHSVLPPAAVSGTLMSILACHGFGRGSFMGHSYGTSWVSYMCKYAPTAVAAVMFLDPICFCLHSPRLTKQFVYHRADPGSTSHMVRTDVIVNWTIQRGFPWARISLFTEQIPCVPTAIFLSENDALVPSRKVQKYLESKGAVVLDASVAGKEHFSTFSEASGHLINVSVFRGQGHGDWPLELSTNKLVAQAAGYLLEQIQ
jgi:pimeloyl-ACP methyl ester carboxylesterase